MDGIQYHTNSNTKAGADFTSASADVVSMPSISIDYALYEPYLEGLDLTEIQKREFLDTLWHIIVNFVDLGFGVHPLQQAMAENQKAQTLDLTKLDPKDVLQSNHTAKHQKPK